jgi:modulator of FtsH protease HflK
VLQALGRRMRKRLFRRRGTYLPGPAVVVLAVASAVLAALHAFTFHVNPDEVGVVMRFGIVVRQEPAGLHLRMPYPIEEVRLPKLTRQNIIEVGMRTSATTSSSGGSAASVREEGMMLTGDENIVDISFVVYWRIQDPVKYLFSIRRPGDTVKDVAESAMREIVGQSNVQPILTDARQKTEQAAQREMQELLDRYGAGIHVDHVQLLKVDPPTNVIDAFRDVQAAATGRQTLLNEAMAYAGRVIPEAGGDAERIVQGAKGYRQQTVAEADGQTMRFGKVIDEYKKAPDVTRTRLYLETMERVLSSADKIIIDSNIVVPFISLVPPQKQK